MPKERAFSMKPSVAATLAGATLRRGSLIPSPPNRIGRVACDHADSRTEPRSSTSPNAFHRTSRQRANCDWQWVVSMPRRRKVSLQASRQCRNRSSWLWGSLSCPIRSQAASSCWTRSSRKAMRKVLESGCSMGSPSNRMPEPAVKALQGMCSNCGSSAVPSGRVACPSCEGRSPGPHS